MKRPVIPTAQLWQEPYASVLCFPQPNEAEAQSRIAELQSLGVETVEFDGKTTLFGVPLPVIGKGFVGIVVVAHVKGERVALKIRRLDADRADLLHEAEMLSKANAVGVAPKLVEASKNFLLMQLINGDVLPEWLKTHKDKAEIQKVLRTALEQCFRLDQAGLDHGELSKAPKHILVDGENEPFIVDFETASDTRKTANVTALSSYLFVGNNEVSRALAQTLGEPDREKTLEALKRYSRSRTHQNFEFVLQACLN
ncbi:MAG: RIO1 family regulatory kinase/ATPase [Candidatus Bathyarchaeia archaeon]